MTVDLAPVRNAIEHLRRSRRSLLLVLLSSLAMFGFTFAVPVVLTPGNSIAYQLSLMAWYNFVLVGLFSLFFGVSFATYHAAATRAGGIVPLLKGGGSGIAGFTGALFSSPVCVSCLTVILAAVGLGGSAVAIFHHQTKVQLLSMGMLGTAFYLASCNLESYCSGCEG